MHITDLLEHQARHRANSVAYYSSRGARTWGQLRDRALRLASVMEGAGAAPGDRVAVLLHEDIESVEAWYACLYAGCLRSGMNPRFTARELADVISLSQPVVLVVSKTLVDVALRAADDVGHHFRAVLVVDGGPDAQPWQDYEAALSGAPQLPGREYASDADIAVCFSSGSTGRPKGVIWSNDRMLASIYNCVVALGLRDDDVWLRDLPTFGVGILMTTWNVLLGFPCVLAPRFEAGQQLRLIQQYGVTGLTGSATTLRRLVDHPDLPSYDLSSLRRVMYGQAPASPSILLRAADRLQCDLVQMYGMTEGHGLFTMLDGKDHAVARREYPERLLSAGRPLPHARIEIRVDGQPVPPGTVGEVSVRGDSVARGYVGDPALTEATFVSGWLLTGDMGRVDEDGYLYIVDRKNFMIVSGGYNIYPAEVEHVISTCPDVRETCVVGCPDDEWGEVVTAVVVRAPGSDPHLVREQVLSRCRQDLAGFKVPKRVEFWDELPMGPSGKLLKREVRERIAGPAGRSVFGAT